MRVLAKVVASFALLSWQSIQTHAAEEAGQGHASEAILGETTLSVEHTRLVAGSRAAWSRALPAGSTWGLGSGGRARIAFEHDVVFAGNLAPAGEYALGIHPTRDGGLQVLLCDADKLSTGTPPDDAEVLRVATPTESGRTRRALMLELRFATYEEEEDEEEREEYEGDEEWEEDPWVELVIAWADRVASIRIESTGVRRQSSPAPVVPERLRAPWQVVQASLEGLAAEDFDLHIADFAEDFYSEFDDGGSAGAHVQLLGHVYHRGGLEGAQLHLSGLAYEEHGEEVEFSNLVIFIPEGRLKFSYRLRSVATGWEVFHLGVDD